MIRKKHIVAVVAGLLLFCAAQARACPWKDAKEQVARWRAQACAQVQKARADTLRQVRVSGDDLREQIERALKEAKEALRGDADSAREQSKRLRVAAENAVEMAKIAGGAFEAFGEVPDEDISDAVTEDLTPVIAKEAKKRLVPPLKDKDARKKIENAVERHVVPAIVGGVKSLLRSLAGLSRRLK